jgi:pyruvate carboxylase
MGAVTLALEQTSLGTGIRYADIQALNLYWTQVRMLYSCFEANVRASDSSVFAHEMPGGQYTNLMVCSCLDTLLSLASTDFGPHQFQASQLGLGTQWTGECGVKSSMSSIVTVTTEVKKKYIEANELVITSFSFLIPARG